MKSSFWKSFVIVHFALLVLIMTWEHGKASSVLAQTISDSEEAIPQESIRLRILADSDAPADQVLKRRVRDEVIHAMSEWVTGPQTLEEARQEVRDRLPELETRVSQMVTQSGFDYNVQLELGVVPFPTKVYGGKVYPAGDYEAVRVTLGRGLGQNWWCVLFPPLCFVDMASGETPKGETGAVETLTHGGEEPKVEYRFFLVEWVADIANEVRSWIV